MPKQRKLTVEDLDKLPLSTLLRLAVADARKARAKGAKLDMDTWYETPAKRGEPCAVCMAGAVMRETLGVKPPAKGTPAEHFENVFDAVNSLHNQSEAFVRIDRMRRGRLPYDVSNEIAYAFCNIVNSDFSGTRDNGRATWRTYLRAAKYLESVGL